VVTWRTSRAAWALLIFTMGTGLVTPLLPLYGSRFDLTSGELTALFVVYVLGVLPAMLVSGQVADQIGRKRPMILGIVLLAGASALFIWAPGVWALFLARLVQGLAIGAFLGVCTAFIIDLAPLEARALTAVAAGVVFRVGFGLGPGVAGVLAEYTGSPLEVPFEVHLVLLVSALAAILSLPETLAERRPVQVKVKLGVPAQHRSAFLAFVALSGALLTMLDGATLSIVPLFIADTLTSNLAVIGLVGFLVLAVGGVSSLLARRLEPRRSVVIGSIAAAAGSFLFAAAAVTETVGPVVAAAVVVGAANGLILRGGNEMCAILAPPADRGKVMSTYYLACYLGMSLPVLGLAYLSEPLGLGPALLGLACVAAIMAAVILTVGRQALDRSTAASPSDAPHGVRRPQPSWGGST
jgi:MFS family permease